MTVVHAIPAFVQVQLAHASGSTMDFCERGTIPGTQPDVPAILPVSFSWRNTNMKVEFVELQLCAVVQLVYKARCVSSRTRCDTFVTRHSAFVTGCDQQSKQNSSHNT